MKLEPPYIIDTSREAIVYAPMKGEAQQYLVSTLAQGIPQPAVSAPGPD